MVGIEAGRDDEQLGGEFTQRRQQLVRHGRAEGGRSRAAREGHVDDVARHPRLLARARTRVEVRLVAGAVEQVRVVPEAVLRAIAVVHVEVHHGHALQAMPFTRMQRGDGGLVEDTETHGTVGLGMVAARARGAEDVPGLLLHHVVHARAGRAHAAQHRLQRARRHDRVAPVQHLVALARRERPHLVHIVRRVDVQHLLEGAEWRITPDGGNEVGRLQRGQHGLQTLGGFGMVRSGLVVEAGFVGVDQGAHGMRVSS